MLSTLKIISAALAAELTTRRLTMYDSVIPSFDTHSIEPASMSKPMVFSCLACLALSWVMSSLLSKPPLSAMMVDNSASKKCAKMAEIIKYYKKLLLFAVFCCVFGCFGLILTMFDYFLLILRSSSFFERVVAVGVR